MSQASMLTCWYFNLGSWDIVYECRVNKPASHVLLCDQLLNFDLKNIMAFVRCHHITAFIGREFDIKVQIRTLFLDVLPSMHWHCWLGGRKGIRPVKNGGWWRWALLSPDGVVPIRMVSVFASVNLPLHHKAQKFSSSTGSPGWSQKNGHKTVVVVDVYLNSFIYLIVICL